MLSLQLILWFLCLFHHGNIDAIRLLSISTFTRHFCTHFGKIKLKLFLLLFHGNIESSNIIYQAFERSLQGNQWFKAAFFHQLQHL